MYKEQGCAAGPELEPPEPVHFGRSRSRSQSSRNISFGARAGAVYKKFWSGFETEENHKKENAKTQNASYSLLSSSHSYGLSSLSDLNGRAHCLGTAPSRLSGHIGQWYQVTVSAQWMDHVAPGRVGDPRTEARPIYLFIYLHVFVSIIYNAFHGHSIRGY